MLRCAPLLLACLVPLAAQQAPSSLTIHADQVVAKVSPTLYGLMTEEINHAFDGGLYAELIRNRTFQDDWTQPVAWTLRSPDTTSTVAVDEFSGPGAIPASLRWNIKQADVAHPAEISNGGFWGIPVRPGTTYTGSLYAKSEDAVGPITVKLVNNASGAVAATATVTAPTDQWARYAFTLTTAGIESSADYSFVLTVAHPGLVRLTLVSLFPPTYNHRVNGDRPDLMNLLAALHPAFLRFPGGNFLEGDHLADWYNWKETIGPLVDRPTHLSPWRYRSSDGMGLLEYLEWCEDLHMQPVLAVYAGYSLQREHIEPGAALAPYVRDALDEIQYVSGAATTTWGARRARDGHAAPFPLTYVEIGNEDNFDRSGSYDGRFAQFYDAIRKAYPKLQLIATTKVTSRVPDVMDDHFYLSAQRFFNDTHHYDKTDRNGPKIFVGEWATQEGRPSPDFNAALGDAAWLTGLERNSDIVIMSSYAPLLVNVNPDAAQWGTNLIGYDAMSSYGSPSYYMQAMFARNLGTEVVASSLDAAGPHLFYSVTRDSAHHRLDLKIVNAAAEDATVTLHIDGAPVTDGGKVTTLSADSPTATNSIRDPRHIVPVDSALTGASADFQRTFSRYSITVLEIPLGNMSGKSQVGVARRQQ